MTVPAIIYIDKWGRRPMLIAGLAFMGIFLFIVGALQGHLGRWSDVDGERVWIIRNHDAATKGIIVLAYLFVCSFAVTMGPVSWTYPAEIFSLRVRAKAVSLATATNWMFNFALAWAVPPGFSTIAYKTYFIFGTFNFAGCLHVIFMYPETVGRTLEEVEDIFAAGNVFSAWKIDKNVGRRTLEDMEKGKKTQDKSQVGSHTQNYIGINTFRLVRHLFPLERTPGVISLLAGKPNPTTFPIAGVSLAVRDPRSAIKDKKRESDENADLVEVKLDKALLEEGLQYAEEAGVRSLMKWFCGLQERVHGRRCTLYEESGVDEAVGSQDVLYKAIKAIVNPGEPVFLESPVYPGVPPVLHSLHCEQIEIPTDDQGVDTTHFRKVLESWPAGKPKPKIFYTVPTGCNPTGATASLERRVELLKLSREHDFLILEDDPYYYLYYGDTARPPSYFSLEATLLISDDDSSLPEVGRVIRFDSLSKVLSAGIRIGFASGPQPVLDALIKFTATINLQTPTLTQIITYALLTSPSWGYDGFRLHTEQIAEFYRKKRDVFEGYMRKYLGSSEDGSALAKWATPKAGLFFWFKILIEPDSESDGDSEALIQTKAFQNGVLALPGTVFLPSSQDAQGPRKTGYVRASFSLLNEVEVEEAIIRLKKTILEARDELQNQ
ncbi:hypothetical protein VNI00_015333 [Paramarasmius palmivorus]|uniref:Major facilitator superfamily (MFS) profile domain-containing protein n=1 Tax=Paramarasmius palmivorus TaxID=297713 RepID=A0AAW0BMR0_9AGAR